MTPRMESESIKIGRYWLERFHGNDDGDYWLYNDDGEGMQIKKENFESMIDTYFKENF